jgi:hypothetical protein
MGGSYLGRDLHTPCIPLRLYQMCNSHLQALLWSALIGFRDVLPAGSLFVAPVHYLLADQLDFETTPRLVVCHCCVRKTSVMNLPHTEAEGPCAEVCEEAMMLLVVDFAGFVVSPCRV